MSKRQRVSMRRKRKEAPEWVFPWRPRREGLTPRVLAALLTSLIFGLIFTSLRIQVVPPAPWAERKATTIITLDDVAGRALTMQAREGGPFPSRFVPGEWDGMAAIERVAKDATRWQAPPYEPSLAELPTANPPLRLAAAGMPVWPAVKPPAIAMPPLLHVKPAPILYPLSGIKPELMPRVLPTLHAELPSAALAESWRFLLRLDAAGRVLDCFPLTGGDENGPGPVDAWLRRVVFPPVTGTAERWIAVGLGFVNQSAPLASDGTEPR